jgi:glycosyltransferase involved in cell wall biosynthesis
VVEDSKHIEIIPTGVDVRKFEGFNPRSSRGDHFGFCFARPIHPNWGPDVAIDAFSRIANHVPHARLMLVGEGEEKYVSKLKKSVSRRGLYNRVHFAGRVTEAEYLAILKRSHVFVHPYRHEGYALGLLEAMAAGLPVLTCKGSGVADIIIEGTTGFTFPEEDDQLLAESMLELAKNPAQRLRMGRNARDMISKLYSFDLHAERMLGLYDEVQSGIYDQQRGWRASIKRATDLTKD